MEGVYNFFFYVLLGLVPLIALLYFYVTSTYNHWRNKGVDYIKPSFPFGNLGDVMMGKKSLTDLTIEQYKQFEGKRFFGIFNFATPVLVLRDTTLVEKVLMTDFTYFCDRGDENCAQSNDPFNYYVGHLSGDTWRQIRHKINGAFSNSKLKRMTELISECSSNLLQNIHKQVSDKEPVFIDCLGYGFSQRVIAKCAFGIECDEEGLRTFILHVKKYLLKMKVVHLIILCHMYTPRLIRLLYLLPPVDKVVQYFKNLTSEMIKVRQESHVKRNDFLQILLDLQEEEASENNNYVAEMKNGNKTSANGHKNSFDQRRFSSERKGLLSENVIVSQLFMFLSLGMESSALAITFILTDLAAHPEIQDRVQEEVDSVVARFGGLSYEAVQQMNYLDSVIQESLRLKPGFPYLTRVCVSPYKLPGTDLVLEKGTTVLIPSCAIHLDPQNYDDPEVFNPDRFADNNFKPSTTFLPFGAGPRMCIAVKLVILELKLAIASVMEKYSVRINSKTQFPPRYASMFMPKLQYGIWAEFHPRQSESA